VVTVANALSETAPFPSRLSAHLAADLKSVDAKIVSALHSDVELVQQIASYIVQGGGKRLRPALALLSHQALGGDNTAESAIAVAAIVELIHTATLLHDDVVDDSDLRRGRATANAAFGNASSVLVGDFLYSRSFQLMVETDQMRVLRILSNATNVIAEGEVHQLMNAGRLDLTQKEYLHVIHAKTAKLFEAACQLGAVILNAPTSLETRMAQYGASLGTAFQIADDVLDYDGDVAQIGKNLGDDLAEGKLTLPIIRALEVANTQDRATLVAAIEARATQSFETVHHILINTGAIDFAMDTARSHARLACEAIAPLPESPAKVLLLECAAFATQREK
jgi:octaprenyl-diphosphate synthase